MGMLIRELKTSLLISLILLFVTSCFYPMVVWGIAQGLFPGAARGSLITANGKVIGSTLLAQSFAGERYFHPRPSAAGAGYDASASGGSNLGPTSQRWVDSLQTRAAHYRQQNGLADHADVPTDAVMASASGLDPDITWLNAQLQLGRVAKARNLEVTVVQRLVAANTHGRSLGFLGEPGVNVLQLNVALDAVR
jgi:potassium-transporting ATPase KdpC subunit